MMSNICLKSEKSKCSIGCFAGSAVKGVNKQVFNKLLLRKELFLMNTILNHDITEGQQISGTWKSEMAASSKDSKKSSSELIKRQPWICSVYFGYIVISITPHLKTFLAFIYLSECFTQHVFFHTCLKFWISMTNFSWKKYF